MEGLACHQVPGRVAAMPSDWLPQRNHEVRPAWMRRGLEGSVAETFIVAQVGRQRRPDSEPDLRHSGLPRHVFKRRHQRGGYSTPPIFGHDPNALGIQMVATDLVTGRSYCDIIEGGEQRTSLSHYLLYILNRFIECVTGRNQSILVLRERLAHDPSHFVGFIRPSLANLNCLACAAHGERVNPKYQAGKYATIRFETLLLPNTARADPI